MLKNEKLKFVKTHAKCDEYGRGQMTCYKLDSECLNGLSVFKFIKIFIKEAGTNNFVIVLSSKDEPCEKNVNIHKHGILIIDKDYLNNFLYKLSKNKKILTCKVIESAFPIDQTDVDVVTSIKMGQHFFKVYLTIDI